jgi:hypothetical protein
MSSHLQKHVSVFTFKLHWACSDRNKLSRTALTAPASLNRKQTKGQKKDQTEKRKREAEANRNPLKRPRLNNRIEGSALRGAAAAEPDGEAQ